MRGAVVVAAGRLIRAWWMSLGASVLLAVAAGVMLLLAASRSMWPQTVPWAALTVVMAIKAEPVMRYMEATASTLNHPNVYMQGVLGGTAVESGEPAE